MSKIGHLLPLPVVLYYCIYCFLWASLITQLVKNPPAMQETPGPTPGLGGSPGEGIGYPLQYSWASHVVQLEKNLPAMQGTWFNPWVGKIPWRRESLPTPLFLPAEFHGLYSCFLSWNILQLMINTCVCLSNLCLFQETVRSRGEEVFSSFNSYS